MEAEKEKAVVLEDEVHAEESESESEDEIRITPSPKRIKRSHSDSEEDESEAVRLDKDNNDEDDSPPPPPPPPPRQFFPSYNDGRRLYAHLLEPLLQDQTLSHQFLSHSFTNALSSHPNSRCLAEESLIQAASNHPVSFPLALLRVVASSSNNPGIVDDKIPCAAAVRLKHHVSSYLHSIPSLERNYIKSFTFCLMLSLPSNNTIQLHLHEAMTVICSHKDTCDANDIDRELRLGLWHAPVVELVSNLRHATLYADPIGLIIGFANQITNNFQQQHPSWTGDFFIELRQCFHRYFFKPVVEIFLRTASSINSLLSSTTHLDFTADALSSLLHTQRLCYRALCSLPTGFVDSHVDEWVTNSLNYLVKKYHPLKEEEVNELRYAVFDYFILALRIQNRFREIYFRDMSLPVLGFVEDLSASASSSSDRLFVFAIKCLIEMDFHGNRDNTLHRIFTNIVIPNLRLREEDEELFEMNHAEFITRDEMQQTNCHSRRGIAIKLLRYLIVVPLDHRDILNTSIPNEIEEMLKSFAADPTMNWKRKECTIRLVFYLLTERHCSRLFGRHFDVQSFFEKTVVPELLNNDVNKFPMLKATVLKFYSMYWNQVPLSFRVRLNANVLRFLASRSIGVCSYATLCIEKLLSGKTDVIQLKAKDTETADIVPYQPNLLTNLLGASNLPQPEENVLVLESIMQLIGFVGIPNEVVKSCISWLAQFLHNACAKPKNPLIYHRLYEMLAACARKACQMDPALLPFFETNFLPILLNTMENKATVMLPNLCKIIVLFVELSQQPTLPYYLKLFEHVLSPELWKNSGNVQFLVVMIEAFLNKASYKLILEGRLIRLLNIIDLLFTSPFTEKMGYRILIALLQKLGYDVFAPLTAHIWSSLLLRLQGNVTTEFLKFFVLYMSLFLLKHGTVNLENSMNIAQQNVFASIVEGYWIPCLQLMMRTSEMRLSIYASTKLLSESPTLLDVAGAKIWGKLLDGILKLILELKQCEVEGEPETSNSWDSGYLFPSFVYLDGAGDKKEDHWKKMEDPRKFLLASLVKLSALSPGRYSIIIKESLDAVYQVVLRQLCDAYNCKID